MRIAVFTKNRSNPAYEAARLGADRAARRLGAQTAHFVPVQDDDPVEQAALIERAVAERYDAIVLAPTQLARIGAALDSVHAAGIPVFGFVNPIPGGRAVSCVGSDDHDLGLQAARYLYRFLQGRGSVLLVSGPLDSVTSVPRVRAFEDAAKAFPGIAIAGRCVGFYNRAKASEAVAQWLRSHAPFDACLAANDVMALGVLDALAGRKVPVVGVNAIPEAVAAIGRGDLLASADFNAMRMAFLATECALRHLRGEPVPAEIRLPVQIVDRNNYKQWDLPFEQRPLPTLEETLA